MSRKLRTGAGVESRVVRTVVASAEDPGVEGRAVRTVVASAEAPGAFRHFPSVVAPESSAKAGPMDRTSFAAKTGEDLTEKPVSAAKPASVEKHDPVDEPAPVDKSSFGVDPVPAETLVSVKPAAVMKPGSSTVTPTAPSGGKASKPVGAPSGSLPASEESMNRLELMFEEKMPAYFAMFHQMVERRVREAAETLNLTIDGLKIRLDSLEASHFETQKTLERIEDRLALVDEGCKHTRSELEPVKGQIEVLIGAGNGFQTVLDGLREEMRNLATQIDDQNEKLGGIAKSLETAAPSGGSVKSFDPEAHAASLESEYGEDVEDEVVSGSESGSDASFGVRGLRDVLDSLGAREDMKNAFRAAAGAFGIKEDPCKSDEDYVRLLEDVSVKPVRGTTAFPTKYPDSPVDLNPKWFSGDGTRKLGNVSFAVGFALYNTGISDDEHPGIILEEVWPIVVQQFLTYTGDFPFLESVKSVLDESHAKEGGK